MYSGENLCIYRGPNNTIDTVAIERGQYYPNEIQCKYNPSKKPVTIRDIMNSIKEAMQ